MELDFGNELNASQVFYLLNVDVLLLDKLATSLETLESVEVQ